MGLRCSHDAFYGSYSAFDRLRRAVCEAIGGSWPPHEDPDLDPEKWYHPNDFNRQKNAGIIFFLNHSDVYGKFTPFECKLVSRDLHKILDTVSEKYGGGHLAAVGGVRAAIEKFIAGCDRAAMNNEDLLFR